MEGLSHVTVLIVDDNRQMRTMLGAILATAGVRHILYASDGVEALQLLEQSDVDVAFVDYEMPHMNGVQFARRVRADGSRNRTLPLVMLTGHANRSTLGAAIDGGVTEFLCKPFRTGDILARLESVLVRPRNFVEAPGFFGPDRRRQRRPERGMRRRATDIAVLD